MEQQFNKIEDTEEGEEVQKGENKIDLFSLELQWAVDRLLMEWLQLVRLYFLHKRYQQSTKQLALLEETTRGKQLHRQIRIVSFIVVVVVFFVVRTKFFLSQQRHISQ